MLSILKNRKNFKDLKKTLKVVKIGKNFDRGGTFAGWPEYMYTRPSIVYQNIFEFA